MEFIKKTGAGILLAVLAVFISLSFLNRYSVADSTLEKLKAKIKPEHQEMLFTELSGLKGKEMSKGELFGEMQGVWKRVGEKIEANNHATPDKKINPVSEFKDYNFYITKYSGTGFATENKSSLFWLLFFGTILGGMMYILPMFLDGLPGIKHNGIYHSKWLSRGIPGIILGTILILFYIVLYFYPKYITEQIALFDTLKSLWVQNGEGDRWFMYGILYCLAVTIMGIRMFAKYRHNRYQQIRTASVIFFQLGFAFMIPEILAYLNEPYIQFHVAWPLDYSFFYEYRLYSFTGKADWGYTGGSMTFFGVRTGLIFLIWGLLLSFVAVPAMTWKYGKRWYCSWVCGCGGLAETLGDPFRQQSDKSLKAWKIERYLIYGVLVFAVLMTIAVLITFFTGGFGFSYNLREWYGFLIGSIFSGVIGTGFYPLMGNRMWCRFGCPLAAIMGIIQRFKSRFRITTNGGQCISCGNCSTYCEMGIDVRAYAQRGENIVRASCVGCGVCASVCPRGVLRLENGDDDFDRIRFEVNQ